jgi:hypothetical protein
VVISLVLGLWDSTALTEAPVRDSRITISILAFGEVAVLLVARPSYFLAALGTGSAQITSSLSTIEYRGFLQELLAQLAARNASPGMPEHNVVIVAFDECRHNTPIASGLRCHDRGLRGSRVLVVRDRWVQIGGRDHP